MFGQASLARRTSIARRRSYSTSTPAPTGGLNQRDALSDMKPDEASILENWFPEQGDVRVRRGHSSHATGLGASVESLMAWHSPSSSKLFGAADDEIFDVTSSGAVGSAAVGSLTNGRWQHVNFGTSGGHFLIACNGADTPVTYNGSAWGTVGFTGSGLTTSTLVHVNAHRQRLFFIETASTSFWYLDVNAITGTATEYPLYSFFKLGGYLMAMGTWTRDGGDGSDDMAVFLSSKGEAVVFYGSDPSTAADWFSVGTFRIGKPIGRRCMVKIGADLVIITEDGVVPMSRVLPTGRSDPNAALTRKISEGFNDAVRNYGSLYGWQPILYPKGHMGVFNVPLSSTESFQYVVNTETGAWTKFTGLDAACWEVYADNLYFGGTDGSVYLADTGENDNGAFISTDARTAFHYFGKPAQLKQFRMLRPLIASVGDVNPAVAVNVDFADTQPAVSPGLLVSPGTEWDAAYWDEADWGPSETIVSGWTAVGGLGYCAAIRFRTQTKAQGAKWFANDWVLEPAGMI